MYLYSRQVYLVATTVLSASHCSSSSVTAIISKYIVASPQHSVFVIVTVSTPTPGRLVHKLLLSLLGTPRCHRRFICIPLPIIFHHCNNFQIHGGVPAAPSPCHYNHVHPTSCQFTHKLRLSSLNITSRVIYKRNPPAESTPSRPYKHHIFAIATQHSCPLLPRS